MHPNRTAYPRSQHCLAVLGIYCLCCALAACTQGGARQCANIEPNVDWYVGQEKPLIFCPKGFKIPSRGQNERSGCTFVVLGDGQTRFYIPQGPRGPGFRQQALAYRKASLSPAGQKLAKFKETTSDAVSLLLTLVVLCGSKT